jgi:hypothetical protein
MLDQQELDDLLSTTTFSMGDILVDLEVCKKTFDARKDVTAALSFDVNIAVVQLCGLVRDECSELLAHMSLDDVKMHPIIAKIQAIERRESTETDMHIPELQIRFSLMIAHQIFKRWKGQQVEKNNGLGEQEWYQIKDAVSRILFP